MKPIFCIIFLFFSRLILGQQTYTAPPKGAYIQEVSYKTALELCDSGKYGEARSMLESLLAENPNNFDFWWTLSYSQSQLNNTVPALNCLKKAQSISDENHDKFLLNTLGRRFFDDNNFDEARRLYYRALVYDNNYISPLSNLLTLYKDKKDFCNARKIFLRLVKADTMQSSWPFTQMGYMYEDSRQYDSAIKYFQIATTLNKKDYSASLALGYCLTLVGKKELGITQMENLEHELPEDGEVPRWNGYAYYEMDSTKKALEKFNSAEKLLTNNKKALADVFYYESLCYEKQKNFDSALHYSKLASENDPGKWVFLEKVSSDYLGKKDYDNAIAVARLMMEKFPDQYIYPLQDIASIYIKKKDYNQALDYSLKVLKIDPENFGTLIDIGYIYWRLHNNKANVEYTRSALRLQPNSIIAHANYGEGLLLTGKKEEALEELEILQKLGAKKEADYLSDLITGKKKSYDLKE